MTGSSRLMERLKFSVRHKENDSDGAEDGNDGAEDDSDGDEDGYESWTYGLIIYQLPDMDSFARVGVFNSSARHGWGMRLFENCDPITISLI